jgi:aspartyl-tRNA synthetase
MECVETLIRRLWAELLDIELPSPFPRMTYENAMSRYGSDKPDVRFGAVISRVEKDIPTELIRNMTSLTDPVIEAIVFPSEKIFDSDPTRTREFTKAFFDSADAAEFHTNPSGGPGIFIYDPSRPLEGLHAFGFHAASVIKSKLSLRPGDLLILQARPNASFTTGSTPLGNLRLAIHKFAVQKSHLSPTTGFAPLWITPFPLFTAIPSTSPSSPSHPSPPASSSTPVLPLPEENMPTLASTHHPFTSPATAADVAYLLTSPHLAMADHYDLVINGAELGGGSRRIHHAAVQQIVLRDVLRLPSERLRDFAHLLEVLRAGCPPHAGLALGLDRLVAVMLNRASVRDVIAFPKSGRGEDTLVGAPAPLGEEVLEKYHLKIKE